VFRPVVLKIKYECYCEAKKKRVSISGLLSFKVLILKLEKRAHDLEKYRNSVLARNIVHTFVLLNKILNAIKMSRFLPLSGFSKLMLGI
jgi:hypothetical protein